MQCLYCGNKETKVVDKRDVERQTRRRRECLKCKKRFTTREIAEWLELRVIKKDGTRENYNPEKIKKGIMKACEKRPVSSEQIEKMVINIEDKLRKRGGKEVGSGHIGDLASKEIKKIDKVAYIRFASVYKDFTEIDDFKKEIKELNK